MHVWLIILKLYFYFNISQAHQVALVQSLLSIYSMVSTSHQYYMGLSIWTWHQKYLKNPKEQEA